MNSIATTFSKNKGLNTHGSSSSSTWSGNEFKLSSGKKVSVDENISSVDIHESDISRKRIANLTDSEEVRDEVFLYLLVLFFDLWLTLNISLDLGPSSNLLI